MMMMMIMMMMMMMKGSLSGLLLLLFLSGSASGLGSVLQKSYGFITRPMTWSEAQSYCRRTNQYSDLATVYTQSDADGLSMNRYDAWIGLHKSDNNFYFSSSSISWVWSSGGYVDYFIYRAWGDNEPHNKDHCALVHSNKKLYGQLCDAYHLFLCHEIRQNGDYDYHFIGVGKNWSEAQQYCRDNYDDLAKFTEYSDLEDTVIEQDFPVWIGLHRDGESWKWSTGESEYRKWDAGEPGSDDCVAISSKDRKMATRSCSLRFPFVCIRENVLLVRENKTWEEALEHCRSLSTSYYPHYPYELVSVQPQDYNIVMTKVAGADTEKVWTGLRFLAGEWLWVNGANRWPSELPDCPVEGQHCGAINKNNTGGFETLDCEERWNFLCYVAY